MSDALSQDQIELLRRLPREYEREQKMTEKDRAIAGTIGRGLVRELASFNYARTPATDVLLASIDQAREQALAEVDLAAVALVEREEDFRVESDGVDAIDLCTYDSDLHGNRLIERRPTFTQALFAAANSPSPNPAEGE